MDPDLSCLLHLAGIALGWDIMRVSLGVALSPHVHSVARSFPHYSRTPHLRLVYCQYSLFIQELSSRNHAPTSTSTGRVVSAKSRWCCSAAVPPKGGAPSEFECWKDKD
jgi:hypothetical protein